MSYLPGAVDVFVCRADAVWEGREVLADGYPATVGVNANYVDERSIVVELADERRSCSNDDFEVGRSLGRQLSEFLSDRRNKSGGIGVVS